MLLSLALSAALLTSPGCLVARDTVPGCQVVPTLRGAAALALTPDTVFVAGRKAITALHRDPLSYAGSTPGGAEALALSPDGAFLYAAGESGTAWYPAAGPLRRLGATTAGGSAIAVAPDGLHAYTADPGADAVYAFRRDPATGALTAQSCVSRAGGACARGTALAGVFDLAIAPDARNLYAITPDALISFAIGGDGNLAERRHTHLEDPHDIQIAPDGRDVAVLSSQQLVTLARDGAGALTPGACFYETDTPTHGRIDGCRPATFDGTNVLAFTPDGRQLIVGGDKNLAVLARDAASGRLTPLACLNDSDDGLDHRCAPAHLVEFPSAVASDGRAIYVATRQDSVSVLVPGQG